MNVCFAAKSDDGVSLGGQDPQNSPLGGSLLSSCGLDAGIPWFRKKRNF